MFQTYSSMGSKYDASLSSRGTICFLQCKNFSKSKYFQLRNDIVKIYDTDCNARHMEDLVLVLVSLTHFVGTRTLKTYTNAQYQVVLNIKVSDHHFMYQLSICVVRDP